MWVVEKSPDQKPQLKFQFLGRKNKVWDCLSSLWSLNMWPCIPRKQIYAVATDVFIKVLRPGSICFSRRLRVDLILPYNLSNGSFDLPKEIAFTRPPCSSLRGHNLRLSWLNWKKAASSLRSVEPWNELPPFVVESPSVDVFDSRLDACWTEASQTVT